MRGGTPPNIRIRKERFMLEILLLLIFCIVLYVTAIVFVQVIKRTDTKTAQSLVKTFLKDCFSNDVPQDITYYPVDIGINANGSVSLAVIEQQFSELNTIFEDYHCANAFYDNEIINYIFTIGTVKKTIAEDEILPFSYDKCNSIIHRYAHLHDLTFTSCDNLVAVNIIDNNLFVMVARTNIATNKIATYKEMRQALSNNKVQICQDIIDKWGA